MRNEERDMEYNNSTKQEEFPPSPPTIRLTNAEIVEPFSQAIMLEHTPTKLDSQKRFHRPQMSSAVSGYETAQQTPVAKHEQRGRLEHETSFISSSSSNTAFDRALPTAQILSLDSSPENVPYSHGIDNVHDLERGEEKKTTRDTATRNDSSPNFQNRQRSASEEIYNVIKQDYEDNASGLKFYESDIDSVNGSVVYNGAKFRHMSRDSKNRFPSMSSIGTMGSDSDAYHALPQQNTPLKSGTNVDSFETPQIANLTKERRKSRADESGCSSSGRANVNESMSTTNAVILPYQARKQLNSEQQQQSEEMNTFGQQSGNYELPKPKELSTINAPLFLSASPPNLYSKGLPPSGIQKNRLSNNVKANRQQQYQVSEEEYSRSLPRPPALHLRMESSGSISSLGSTMDGATSMVQQQFNRIIDTLGGEMQDYHNENIDGSEHLPRRGGITPPGNESPGYFSSFLDNLSFTSGGSFKSIEDDRADYRKKSQNILKKAEKIKQKAISRNKGWFPESGERKSIRSLSPANRSQRSHRPRLPSIDNDTWDEDEKDESRRKSRSRRGGTLRKKSGKGSKPPIRQKQSAGRYGSVSASRNQRRPDRIKQSSRNRDRGSSSSKRTQAYESDQPESSEDESFISSDFTSNLFDNDSENSSVYIDENGSVSNDDLSFDEKESHNERTSLLPSGISTDELGYPPRRNSNSGRPPSGDEGSRRARRLRDDRQSKKSRQKEKDLRYEREARRGRSSRSQESRYRDSGRSYHSPDPYYSDDTNSSSPEYHGKFGHDDFYEERKKMERHIRKQMRKEIEEQQCCNRFSRWSKVTSEGISNKVRKFVGDAETFIGNMPLTIGAVGLAIVTLGVVWFKFAEEMLETCRPVHFHSSQCNFNEFPGCFYCDTSVKAYKVALGFHQVCSAVAGAIALLFVLKICIARQVVLYEMKSPTTSSPAGLICMTIVCVAAGRGMVGQILVTVAAFVHFWVAVWFITKANYYNIKPDPSWYPNTVGIGISAVKTWLYYPMFGHFLMLISLSFFSFFFPISLVNVTLNKKMSATVAWIQMSGPAVSLYAMTIMAQPSFEEEHPDINEYQRLHRLVYLPCMHFLFVAAMMGAISSAQSLYVRWDSFKKIEFSAAHAAFCFPTLAHANSIQAYRGAINSFSSIPQRSIMKLLLDGYWLFVLVGGTIATLVITAKFFLKLPSWTSFDLDGENEPPHPNETVMSNIARVGDIWGQSFVSPVVLQANEAGALVQVRKNGRTKYVRTRRVTALGFEPIMDMIDFTNERDALLDWVEKNPARTRNRTMSVPGFPNIGNFGSNNRGVYTGTGGLLPTHMGPEDGRNVATPGTERRQRAQTLL